MSFQTISSSEDVAKFDRERGRRLEEWSEPIPVEASSRWTWGAAGLASVGLTAAATVAGLGLEPWLRRADVAMMHLLGIVAVAMRFPVGPAVATTIMSLVSFDYFFIPPRFGFGWIDTRSGIIALTMVMTGAAIAYVNQSLRRDRQTTALRARATAALGQLLSSLAAARTFQQAADVASRELAGLFGASVSILVAPYSLFPLEGLTGEDKGDAEACWRTLSPVISGPSSRPEAVWVPVVGAHRPMGVLGLHRKKGASGRGCLNQSTACRCAEILATAFERIELATATDAAEMRGEVERLRDSLLASIAHEMRTPLGSIVLAGAMLSERSKLDEQRRALVESVVGEAEGLIRHTENLLELARVRTGQLFVRRAAIPVDELLECAFRHIRASVKDRIGGVHLPDDCPMIWGDWRLIELVIVNLLESAVGRASGGAKVGASVSFDRTSVTLCIPGSCEPPEIEAEMKGALESHRLESKVTDGGDELAVVRMLVESHGGMIWVEEADGRGTIARVRFSRAPDIDESSPI